MYWPCRRSFTGQALKRAVGSFYSFRSSHIQSSIIILSIWLHCLCPVMSCGIDRVKWIEVLFICSSCLYLSSINCDLIQVDQCMCDNVNLESYSNILYCLHLEWCSPWVEIVSHNIIYKLPIDTLIRLLILIVLLFENLHNAGKRYHINHHDIISTTNPPAAAT